MSSRSERFKNRKAKLDTRKKSSHLREVPNLGLVNNLLSQDVDREFIASVLEKRSVYELEVSESEVSESLALLDKQFTKEKYNVLFESSKNVLIDQLLAPLKLSRADLSNINRDFVYQRENYTKSSKSAGGDSPSFDTQRRQSKQAAMTPDDKIQDTYTGKLHDASKMDLDHIKSLKAFHNDGGFMLSDAEKRQFAADRDNHEFTHSSLNRSKGEKDLKEFSDANGQVDKRRTNAAHARAERAAEKYVPSGKLEKTAFVTQRAAQDGIKTGANQGFQQALAALISEFVSASFSEVKDIFENGWNNDNYDLAWIDVLKIRLANIAERMLNKWENVVLAFGAGALSGFLSAIITALINMFVRTGKNIVRIIREGFMSLMKAIKTLIFPPEGMTVHQAAHEASKIFATGLVVTGGILAGESLATMLNGIPFADTISMVLTGMISGLGSLFVVFMLDKLDLFGVKATERHKFIMGELEPRISLNIERAEAVIERLELKY